MPRPAGVQLRRQVRADRTVTYSLRVRVGGSDETVPLGNSADGWDETRADTARQQMLAKIVLGQWTPATAPTRFDPGHEPTFAELASEWLADRRRNAGIRERTTDDDRWRLERYLIPFFGELRPSRITPLTVKEYRRSIHADNERITAARSAGRPVVDALTRMPLRTLSNDSINKTLRTLALILDEAQDAGWVARNVARGRRTREPVQRRKGEALDIDELESLLHAASQLDRGEHSPATLARAEQVRDLRDVGHLTWNQIAGRVGVARSTAFWLYGCRERHADVTGPRRAIIATLALAGPRVTELCLLQARDVDLTKDRIYVNDAKTPAGVRVIDIRPRLHDELSSYRTSRAMTAMDAPAFPTRRGTARTKDTVLAGVVVPVVQRANQLRAAAGAPPIRAHVTPHTLRRSYITFMLAAGFDLPYVQDQVGHLDPKTTLAIYAQVIRRPDRDQLRAEARALFGEDRSPLPDERGGRLNEAEPTVWHHVSERERDGLER